MHVYCRRHGIERFCVEHCGMQQCETLLRKSSDLTQLKLSMCDMKTIAISIANTRDSQDDHICIALTDGPDDDGNTYVLRISPDNAKTILGHTSRVTHLTFHYIESMYTDIIVTHVLPDPAWLVGNNERPCLPNASPRVSTYVLRILMMLCDTISSQ